MHRSVVQPYLGVALINGMCDSLHKVVPHASLGVTVSQLRLSLIAGLVAAGRLDQAQQGAAHEEQHQTRRRARRGRRPHDRKRLRGTSILTEWTVFRVLSVFLLALLSTVPAASQPWCVSYNVERESLYRPASAEELLGQRDVGRKVVGGFLHQAAPSPHDLGPPLLEKGHKQENMSRNTRW